MLPILSEVEEVVYGHGPPIIGRCARNEFYGPKLRRITLREEEDASRR